MQNADKKHIVGRYLELFDSEKSRIIRIKIIAEELTNLWKSLNFPIVSHQQVQSKTRSVVDLYEKYSWLCSEDKKFYTTQIQTSGRVGYSTRKEADLNPIHPSK